MCFGGGRPKIDTSVQDQMLEDARKAREREEARQARIDAGTERIDEIFGGFDSGFYSSFVDDIMAAQRPQLERQFGDANDQLTYNLARAGTLKSSIAGDRRGRLQTAYGDGLAQILSGANRQKQALQGRVQNEKSNLVSMLTATGDADRATNEALNRSQKLFDPVPEYNPIGDIFGGIAQGVGNYHYGKQQRDMWNAYQSAAGAPLGRGSARTVTV